MRAKRRIKSVLDELRLVGAEISVERMYSEGTHGTPYDKCYWHLAGVRVYPTVQFDIYYYPHGRNYVVTHPTMVSHHCRGPEELSKFVRERYFGQS